MFERPRSPAEYAQDRVAFTQWLNAANDTGPDKGRSHALQMMGMALREELTGTQRAYLTAYYVDGLTMREIGERHGVDKSTVSRAIKRAESRIKKVLKYSSPILLREALGMVPEVRKPGKRYNSKRRVYYEIPKPEDGKSV